MAKGERFENPEASETIDHNSLSSVSSQSLTEELEVEMETIKTDRTR